VLETTWQMQRQVFEKLLGIMVSNHKRASGGDVRDKAFNAHSYLSVHLRTCCCQSVRQTGGQA